MDVGNRVVLAALVLSGCSSPAFRVSDGSDVRAYVTARNGFSASAPDGLRFRPGLCDGENLTPESGRLTEASVMAFLARQRLDVRVDRPRTDLLYLTVSGAGTDVPVRLRVAILATADDAGRELHEAILQHGAGAWGVRRGNLAVLGPPGSLADDLTFAAKTKLTCWGMFITAGRDDTYAVPGGYREL